MQPINDRKYHWTCSFNCKYELNPPAATHCETCGEATKLPEFIRAACGGGSGAGATTTASILVGLTGAQRMLCEPFKKVAAELHDLVYTASNRARTIPGSCIAVATHAALLIAPIVNTGFMQNDASKIPAALQAIKACQDFFKVLCECDVAEFVDKKTLTNLLQLPSEFARIHTDLDRTLVNFGAADCCLHVSNTVSVDVAAALRDEIITALDKKFDGKERRGLGRFCVDGLVSLDATLPEGRKNPPLESVPAYVQLLGERAARVQMKQDEDEERIAIEKEFAADLNRIARECAIASKESKPAVVATTPQHTPRNFVVGREPYDPTLAPGGEKIDPLAKSIDGSAYSSGPGSATVKRTDVNCCNCVVQ